MSFILCRDEMRDADSRTAMELHVPSAVLMERAALLTAGRVIKRLDDTGEGGSSRSGRKVLIVCGPGNNGGDGFACGRILMERDIFVEFLFVGQEEKMSPLEREQYLSVRALKEDAVFFGSVPVIDHDIIVDALFGISLSRKIEGEYADIVYRINAGRKQGAYVISIDIPSGIDADSAAVQGVAVFADETVSCGFLKPGNVLFPGALYNGRLIEGNIGITEKSLKKRPRISYLEENEIRLPERLPDSNKGSYGKVLIAAGSETIAGAALLSARAALRTGCGMVRVLTHENNRAVIQTALPEALVTTYREDSFSGEKNGQTSLFDYKGKSIEDIVKEAVSWCSVIAAGPGLGTDRNVLRLLKAILDNAGSRPLILDADALNIISNDTELLSGISPETVITPHLMEMSRLTGIPVREVKTHIMDVASDFASGYHVTVVLKDSRTVTAFSNKDIVINLNGNNGMATAGSGDVLTGIIASLAAQGVEPERAAALGAALHGRAGDRASECCGQHGLMATDIIENIG